MSKIEESFTSDCIINQSSFIKNLHLPLVGAPVSAYSPVLIVPLQNTMRRWIGHLLRNGDCTSKSYSNSGMDFVAIWLCTLFYTTKTSALLHHSTLKFTEGFIKHYWFCQLPYHPLLGSSSSGYICSFSLTSAHWYWLSWSWPIIRLRMSFSLPDSFVGHCFYIILPLHALSKVFVYVCHIKPLGRAKKSLLQRFMVSAHSHMCWLTAGHVGCLFAQPVGLSTCLKDVLRAPWVWHSVTGDTSEVSGDGISSLYVETWQQECKKTCVDYLTKPFYVIHHRSSFEWKFFNRLGPRC